MTVNEVISKVDRLSPNEIELEDKLDWLSEIENKVYEEIVLTHEGDDPEWTKYTMDDLDTEVLAGDCYNDFYMYYLLAKIDLVNMETSRYNAHATYFADSYQSFRRLYNRDHMPITKGRIEVR